MPILHDYLQLPKTVKVMRLNMYVNTYDNMIIYLPKCLLLILGTSFAFAMFAAIIKMSLAAEMNGL